jgi:hypothetical protein
VEHTFGEYAGMLVSSPIQGTMETDENSEEESNSHPSSLSFDVEP